MTEVVLAIDTSTRVSVGLAIDGAVIARASDGDSRSHVELLMPTVADLLERADVAATDLTAIVVGMGPGPYTGLRVGIAGAEMLAMVSGASLHHVCSLDVIALSWSMTHPQTKFIVATDARRHELYWAVYDRLGQRLDGPNVSAPDELPQESLVGPGALLYPQAAGGLDSFLALKLGVRVDALAAAWPKPEDVPQIVGLDAGVMAQGVNRLAEVGPEPLYLRHADASAPGRVKSVLPATIPATNAQMAARSER
ncbi:MAG: tRNA (adenosine(37)-N6)-threonylcarbamoyltransferase complex dimerization subunit type 1 TsaB [Propionibacteriaceae bacterium]|nr:tRNA (adenosine(37)-N6)-threonylcarbamoyltransferase complex dimerization subunit type 1 TsaB [Propionibacteriaceae bacterium]